MEHLDKSGEFFKRFVHFFDYQFIEVPEFDYSLLNQNRQELKLSLVYTDRDHTFEFDRKDLFALLERNKMAVISAAFRFGVQQRWCKAPSSTSN